MDSVERRETPDEGIKAIRLGIRLLIMVIFLGYIMIWVMMPTNTFWQHWLPDIQDKVNSTYFGRQGTNFLIYTFPILFVAVLGCIYLHLGEKDVGRSNGRRKFFELFFYTHYLYIIFIVFFIFHVGFSYFCITLPGFYLFLIDRYLRFLQSQQMARLVSARILPCEAVELNFSKSPGLSYNPTSSMFINVPGISKLQWHPFTITSNNNTDQDRLSVVIKSTGSWSRLLYQQLSQPIPPDHLEVSVEGPYGPASTHFFRHDTLVLISGGSGITPFCSIIRELLFSTSTRSCRTKQVLLIAAFKKSVDLAMLDVLVSDANYNITQFPLRIEAYVTREKELTSDDQKLFQTIWFKPSATDAPVSAILGSNSWLWLGAIISSSFLTFLLLIGIVTRYYIYPIDHNTNMRFSYAENSALNMLFGCVSVALAATTAFIWNQKQNAKEMIQIQNMDVPTPKGSPGPGSWLYNGERELESFPHESLFQNTKVHYGERPNFKKLLQECEGSSIGILVSGPKKMGQEVAAICSSSEADNLHFESISFSW
ncbi:hypothetical protein RHGRI_008553 [Rhododendron griersonianum]|uniref:FAD-binding FR-type domain-containing protein n=1 Tax=Rhododendron griersonianum TaxID=479676 RepID=A0AAV6L3X2_9ERIC|nr:hypothetical protein RHGRI_008553 [Rhododendron griersonianum]